MGEKTKIPWCHHTFNPWWGCTKASAGCDHCYAERLAVRYGFQLWGMDAPRRTFSEKHWREPLKWNADAEKAGERRRVFCGSMCDLFERIDDRAIGAELATLRVRLWELIAATPSLDWLLLTKRPENISAMAPGEWEHRWPQNVWMLTTVECQNVIDRLVALRATNAVVRGISIEPMIGGAFTPAALNLLQPKWGVDWVIVGCESGPRRRRCELPWVRELVARCRELGVPVFVKQLEIAGRVETDPRRWPEDLRIQEFPTPTPIYGESPLVPAMRVMADLKRFEGKG